MAEVVARSAAYLRHDVKCCVCLLVFVLAGGQKLKSGENRSARQPYEENSSR